MEMELHGRVVERPAAFLMVQFLADLVGHDLTHERADLVSQGVLFGCVVDMHLMNR